MSDYPEHEKLKEVSDISQAQGEFLEWLQDEKGWMLFDCDGDLPCPYPVSRLLAEYHGIDQEKIEQEKQAMLDRIRKAGQ